ncbi:MAG: hypothetical protein MI866_15755, partial [Bacteroidales bacterium]|nr:hypothetical protein [Bacteroidales bacterium]
MQFELDAQTIKDLDIFGDGRSSKSIFSFYNKTKTVGGRDYLMRIMRIPSTDFQELFNRKSTIEYFSTNNIEFVFNESQFDFIERYCKLNIPPLKDNIINAIFQNLSYTLKPNNDYYIIQTGIQHLKHLFAYLKSFVSEIEHNNIPANLRDDISFIIEFINKREFDAFVGNRKGIKKGQLNRLDYLLRDKYINELLKLVRILYKFDALSSVGMIANKKNLSFPEFVDTSVPTLSIQNLYHPLLDNAVPYDFDFTKNKNLCFLTGPNMAGKSTFLKSIGLSIYISHLGFPVA